MAAGMQPPGMNSTNNHRSRNRADRHQSVYVETSHDCAELVTDDKAALREQLEAVTGERITALEGIGETSREAPERAGEIARGGQSASKDREAPTLERGRTGGMDLGP